MSTSFTVAGRNNGFTKPDIRAATLASVRAYRESMAEFAKMGTMDLWYARLTSRISWPRSETFARRVELLLRGLEDGRAGPAEDDVRALLEEPPRGGPADAAATAGDEDDLACELVGHGLALLMGEVALRARAVDADA